MQSYRTIRLGKTNASFGGVEPMSKGATVVQKNFPGSEGNSPVATTGSDPSAPATMFLSLTVHESNGKKKIGELVEDGMYQLKKELALVRSGLSLEHPSNSLMHRDLGATTSKSFEMDKGGTQEEASRSAKIYEEEEAREFSYYMTRQAHNSASKN